MSGAPENAIVHGGNLDAARRRFPDAPEPWIDLSTGINPLPYPVPELPASCWTRLPTREDEARLLESAARRYGVADLASIVAAPGTQALIQVLPRLEPPSRVAVLGPTYEEHRASWMRCGHEVREIGGLDEAGDFDVAILVNPNNPTGRLVPPEELRAFAAMRGGGLRLLVVDEAFADVIPGQASLAPALPPRTVVLKSFGKTYGLAGLRLGFVIAGPEIAAAIRRELGPWAASGAAIEIGARALADDVWLAAETARLARDRQRLDRLLEAAGFAVVGGTPLFCLASHPGAQRIAQRLGHYGIHLRAFPHQPGWLRFGLPGAASEWGRLEAALLGESHSPLPDA
jgi:cobalamin biosynthetic protein CobC